MFGLISNMSSVFQAPAQEVMDKVYFLINNISAANLEAKAREFTELLKEQYNPWFADYMVMKRLDVLIKEVTLC